MNEDTDGPADERCEACGRLDPINCPCEPEEETDRRIRAAITEPPEWPGPVVTTLRQTLRVEGYPKELPEDRYAFLRYDDWGTE